MYSRPSVSNIFEARACLRQMRLPSVLSLGPGRLTRDVFHPRSNLRPYLLKPATILNTCFELAGIRMTQILHDLVLGNKDMFSEKK